MCVYVNIVLLYYIGYCVCMFVVQLSVVRMFVSQYGRTAVAEYCKINQIKSNHDSIHYCDSLTLFMNKLVGC